MSDASPEPPPAGSTGLSDRLLPLVAVALMLVVAGIQQINVHANELAPDVGGGFGMFAFVDNTAWRTVIVTLEDSDGRAWTLDLETRGPDLDLSAREVQRVAALPSPTTLAAIGELVRTTPWYLDESGDEITSMVEGELALEIVDVSIVVYGVEFHRDDDKVHRKVIATWPGAS